MKVYIVVDHVCEADIVRGVFSTRAKAKTFINAAKNKEWPDSMECGQVEEWIVDSMERKP